jgi:DNA invertase Pin-like site-specific DNA recombinase
MNQPTSISPTVLTPAAQYVRMSTEDQENSIANQKSAIQQYASQRGFDIVRTYEDAGKSGLLLKHRRGLQQLLGDVIGGSADYKAVLVIDCSRWGRFQNSDEAAYYECLCTNSGIRSIIVQSPSEMTRHP